MIVGVGTYGSMAFWIIAICRFLSSNSSISRKSISTPSNKSNPEPSVPNTSPWKLKEHGIDESWATLLEKLSRQYRITATFRQRDGKTLHIRQAMRPEQELSSLYTKLRIPPDPGGLQRVTI